MTKLLNDHYEIVTVVKKPAIELASGHVVSRGSENYLSSVDAVRFVAVLQQPLQTGDLAIIIRDQLDKEPLLENGKKTLDGSDLYQRLSDMVLFYRNDSGLAIAVSDLPTMYGKDWDAQIAVAEKIGWGKDLPMKDELVQRILETAGKRKAQVPQSHWPYSVPSATLGQDAIALAFFPSEAGRNGEYLVRKGRDNCNFYLINPGMPKSLNGTKTGVVRPVGLGGNVYYDVSYVGAVGGYVSSGRARAGSTGAKNSP